MSNLNSFVLKLYMIFVILLFSGMGCANVINSIEHKILPTENIMLTPENTINLRTAVTGNSIKATMDKIVELRAKNPKATLYLVINSPGGSIDVGMDFIRFLESQENIKTITIFAASMASAIAEANPNERLMVKGATFMFHRAAGTFQGYFNDGEVESQLAQAKKVVDMLEEYNYKRIGISKAKYKELVKNEWWIVGDDAIKENVADRIVNIKCDNNLLKQKIKIEVATLFGTFEDEVSACPLLY